MTSDDAGRGARNALEETTAERLAAIVAAAESAAQKVIDDAEAEAGERLRSAERDAERIVTARAERLRKVADRLAEGAEALRAGADELAAEIEHARRELDGRRPSLVTEPDAPPVRAVDDAAPARKSHLSAVASGPNEASPDDRGTGPGGSASLAGARLLATQMAVSGSSRGDIERRLRTGFEIEDPAPILDAILGPEG